MGAKSIRRQVAEASGTNTRDWTHIDGPSTGVGVEFWLRHSRGHEAYVVSDQGELRISITPHERSL